jgi:hypothetical protein
MDKERNEIGKDVVGRSKTTKASPRCLLKFLKKMIEPEVKKDELTIHEIEDPLPMVSEVISVGVCGILDHWQSSINPVGFKLILPH